MNSTLYDYLRDNYGYKNNIGRGNRFEGEIKTLLKKDLKKELKNLKLNNASINIIKYVAKGIRSRINKTPISITVATDNDDEIRRNFWSYVKKVFRSGTSVLPSFDTVRGTTYFINALKHVNRMKVLSTKFSSTREALKHICSLDVSCRMKKLTIQSLVVKSIWEFVDGRFINQWSNVISHLPQNIFSFTILYLSNTLENGTNPIKWGMTNNSTRTFCDQQQALGHVISGCKTALLESRYNWPHDSILLNICKTINQ